MAKDLSLLEPELTLKQRKFLKLYFQVGNGTKAAMAIYNCKDMKSAAALASETLSKLKNPIKTFMEARGISLGKLTEVLEEGLSANKVISAVNTGKQANGQTADFIEVPDLQVRHKYLETAAKWLEVEKPPVTLQQINQQYTFFPVNDQERAERQEFNNHFKEFLKKLPAAGA